MFLSLLFSLKKQGKPLKKTRIFSRCRTPKIPGKEGKNAQKSKEIPCNQKSKETKKIKERNIRVALRCCESGGTSSPRTEQEPKMCHKCFEHSFCGGGCWGEGLWGDTKVLMLRFSTIYQAGGELSAPNRAILCGCGGDFTAPPKIARFLEAPRCAISSAKKLLANRDFFCAGMGTLLTFSSLN